MLQNLGRVYLKVFYQLRFNWAEIFNCIHELIKTCEVMWTTLGIEIWALLSTDLFCLLCSFIVIHRHRLLCTNSSCVTLSIYFFFAKCVLHQKTFDFHPLMRLDMSCICALQSTLPLISLSIQMKRNQATFPSFQLVSLISCSLKQPSCGLLDSLLLVWWLMPSRRQHAALRFLISRLPVL